MSYNYEAVVIFNPDLDESAVREQTQKIETLVKAHGGAVARHDTWGKRPLGFRMNKKSHGIYTLATFTGDASLVADLDRQLRINESCLRHLIVKKDKHAPDIAPGAHPDETFSFGIGGGFGDGSDGGPGADGGPGM